MGKLIREALFTSYTNINLQMIGPSLIHAYMVWSIRHLEYGADEYQKGINNGTQTVEAEEGVSFKEGFIFCKYSSRICTMFFQKCVSYIAYSNNCLDFMGPKIPDGE